MSRASLPRLAVKGLGGRTSSNVGLQRSWDGGQQMHRLQKFVMGLWQLAALLVGGHTPRWPRLPGHDRARVRAQGLRARPPLAEC